MLVKNMFTTGHLLVKNGCCTLWFTINGRQILLGNLP